MGVCSRAELLTRAPDPIDAAPRIPANRLNAWDAIHATAAQRPSRGSHEARSATKDTCRQAFVIVSASSPEAAVDRRTGPKPVASRTETLTTTVSTADCRTSTIDTHHGHAARTTHPRHAPTTDPSPKYACGIPTPQCATRLSARGDTQTPLRVRVGAKESGVRIALLYIPQLPRADPPGTSMARCGVKWTPRCRMVWSQSAAGRSSYVSHISSGRLYAEHRANLP